MSAQEFASPGDHMASMGSSVVDVGKSNGTGPGESRNVASNIIYSPGAFDNLNRGYALHNDEYNGSSAKERNDRYSNYYDVSKNYNQQYMQYNNDLFNSAKEYDEYMSNTAIQRQVADLKKAGLNPILATRLGGAAYKGVNAPYLSISPSSALNAFLDYNATMYASDVNARTQIETTLLRNSSQEFISQFNKVMDLSLQGNLFEHEEEMVYLKRDVDSFLENLKHLNQVDLQKLGFQNQKSLIMFQNDVDKNFYNFKKYYGNTNPDMIYRTSMFFLDKISSLIPYAGSILN